MKVLTVELTQEEMCDVIDRVWHACHYWASMHENQRAADGSPALVLQDDDTGEALIVDGAAVHRGVCLALSNEMRLGQLSLFGGPAQLCVDLPTVDKIVQYGVFGKLVYV